MEMAVSQPSAALFRPVVGNSWKPLFGFLCASIPAILGPLSAPPLPPTQIPRRTGKGACLGCGIAAAVAIVIFTIVAIIVVQQISNSINTDENQRSVVGSSYVGEWQDINNPQSYIQIQPNGSASCQIVHGTSHYSINGGRATFDKQTQRLSVKLFIFGPTWHVEEPPHQTGDGVVMKLDGMTFRKLRSFPSPSGSPGSGVAI